MMIVIDIGNTFIKWKLWSREGATHSIGSASATENLDVVFAFANGLDITTVVIANVAKAEIDKQLQRLFNKAKIISVHSTNQCLGVSNAYEEAGRLGVDRWVGVIEAHHLANGKAACVIDLGTAATLDVVDESGQHLGGYIVPGLGLMRSSLLRSTERVKINDDDSATVDYGRNTSQAVEGGLSNLIKSWLEYELKLFWQKFPEGCVFVTGGDAEQVQQLVNDNRITICKELLLDGMRRVALQ